MIPINGWSIGAHPLFLDQLERLANQVARERAKNPHDYRNGLNAKLLRALRELAFEKIPEDPTREIYRQGGTLGASRKHWFRAKFGNGRFRLFFRFDSRAKVILLAWVNDENSLRTYGSREDAYKVFRRMLDKGNPPDDWSGLLAGCSDDRTRKRLEAMGPTPASTSGRRSRRSPTA